MVSRGLFIKKPESIKSGWHFMAYMMYIIHRFHYPSLVIYILVNLLISNFIIKDLRFFFVGFLLLEVFYLSIAFHEACHMAFAKFTKIETQYISIVPWSFEIRVHFSKEKIIPSQDLIAILFAGPVLPIVLSILLLLISIRFKYNILVIMCILIFMLINIMSLLPVKDSDGARVYRYIKNNPKFVKLLFLAIIYYICTKLGIERLKKIITGG